MTANTHIREFLAYYCSLPKEPQHAVLLTGLWGSGKTWFIKDFVAKHVPQPKRFLYLSLYGVQSFDDIETELFRLLHPVLGSKPARILGRLARGVLKTSINFDLDGDGKSDCNLSGGVPAEKLLERVSLDSNHILILDDLERCSIPISDLLGYANQFVEHGGIKAILIANECEIISRGHDAGYARIKEKLIGRTFEVVPEVDSALEHFASDLCTPEAEKVVRANLSVITRVYKCSGYKNLRLVRHALWDFARLLEAVDPALQKLDLLLSDLLALFLLYSLEVKSGAIQPSQIKNLRGSWSSYFSEETGEADRDQQFSKIRKKYSELDLCSSLIQDNLWEGIFATGSIPTGELNDSLKRSKYFQQENQPTWVKLWHGMVLSDEEFASVLVKAKDEWDRRSFRQIGEVVHVAGLFVHFAKHGIIGESVEAVVQSAQNYIDHLFVENITPIRQADFRTWFFERDVYEGRGFFGLDDARFKALLAYIDKRRKEVMASGLPVQAKDLVSLIGVDTQLFFRRITLGNDPENIYYETPILHLTKPAEFLQRLLSASAEDRSVVARAFEQRYSRSPFNQELLPELDWLREVASALRAEIVQRAGKISALSLGMVVEPRITHAIAQLQEVSALVAE